MAKPLILDNGCSILWNGYWKVYRVSLPNCHNAKEFKRNEKQAAIEWAKNEVK